MKSYFAIIVLLFVFIGCTREVLYIPEPFLGEYTCFKASKDGIVLENWNDLEVVFEQYFENEGSYQMKNSPNEAVWDKFGFWTKTGDELKIEFNDGSIVTIVSMGDTLRMQKTLPWTADPCLDVICPTTEGGIWDFNFKKH